MNTSLIITVFNEEKTIDRLLNSLARQTKKPEEIIFIDGGSTDNTVVEMKKWRMENEELNIKILIKNGATIAQGRNRGIKEAKGEIIAMTDAGCEVHPDWFEKITAPFEKKDVDIIAGFYRMTGDSIFQQCLACYLGVLPERLDSKNFMPSFRSVALKKEIWEKVGGFNEKLDRCGEDTLFNYQAKQLGAKFLTVKEALVDWEMPKTLKEGIKKFYFYAKGDGQIGIWWDKNKKLKTHNIKLLIIYVRYLFGLALFLLGFFNPSFWFALAFFFLIYLFWAILKSYNDIRRRQAILFLPMIQVMSDLAVMIGFAVGSLKRR